MTQKYLKNKKRISDYDSENLTYNLIEEVIKILQNNIVNYILLNRYVIILIVINLLFKMLVKKIMFI